MTKAFVSMRISLDGFVAGENRGPINTEKCVRAGDVSRVESHETEDRRGIF